MIKTLDWDLGDEQLEFLLGGNGDCYVRIWYTEYDEHFKKVLKKYKSVRVGGAGSGDRTDPKLRGCLFEAARIYEDLYKDSEFVER